ncbi:MAG: sulfide/dihydroorotate dehydrogenase-like FAD/NAD-binding protein [Lachnospiraceae bacterium]|nr:sulfide/dihydroorotate dehydrogenase-like FAD/NAD-binding protein [Lachnospiraceae bacterium]
MYRILNARWLNENIFLMDIEAKRVANRCQPGQFIIVRVDKDGERIPLTICDYDREKGSVTIVAQVVGAETYRLSKLQVGDYVQDFVGPLGKASEFVETPAEKLKQKKILFIAGGVGAAPVYPQVKWLKEQGVPSDVILGARSKEILILEEELKAVAQNLYISTDDGSYGTKGTASVVLQNLYDAGQTYDVCVVIGPMIMMKYTCLLTKKLGLPTVVSMNPIMVDGTGMCGACRLTVGNEVKFACVDGPEFDGHLVNFDEAMKRQTLYKTEEGRAYLRAKEGDTHHGGCGQCGGDRA